MGERAPQSFAAEPADLRRRQAPQLLGKDLDPGRGGDFLAGEDRHDAGEVEVALAGKPPVAERVVQQRAGGRGGSVADLEGEDALARDLLEQRVVAQAPEVVPRVEYEASVRTVR